VIASGTCGTGCILELAGTEGAERHPWLEPFDQVVLTVERLGELRNPIGPRSGGPDRGSHRQPAAP